jgi:hypothetical protein
VALDAAKDEQALGELVGKHSVHPNQESQWKRQLVESGADVFSHYQQLRLQSSSPAKWIQKGQVPAHSARPVRGDTSRVLDIGVNHI